MAFGHLHQAAGDPGVVGLDQTQLAERIFAMGVEAGRNEQHLRRKGIQARQPVLIDQCAHVGATSACGHGQVQQVARAGHVAAVRVMRMLEKADHQHPIVASNDVLGAIAMVHIEVDDRDTLQSMRCQCMACRDGDVVEEAKAHCRAVRRMVTRWAHRTEGIAHLACHHRVGGGDGRTGGTANRGPGAGPGHRVGVEDMGSATRGQRLQCALQPIDMRRIVRLAYTVQIDQWRLAPLQHGSQAAGLQLLVDGFQPLWRLGVTARHHMGEAVRMTEEGGGHASSRDKATGASVNVSMMSAVPMPNLTEDLTRLIDQISTIIVGKRSQIRDCVACLLAGGHLLIEDVPGVGKTTLAHALSVSLGLRFSRVQFTADLMPTDLIGVSVYERSKEAFVFHPGPVFAQVLLADEINRAGPRTQSALLEAMEEQQISVEGESRALPRPFFVIATQNPSDQLGTYALPESQLDRFLMCITLGYPDRASERELLAGQDRREAVQQLRAVMTPEQLIDAQRAVLAVHASPALLDYLQALIAATRSGVWFVEGLSPRAGIAVLRAAKAYALLDRRNHVAPDDVQAILVQTIAHRLVPVASAGRGRAEQVRAMIEATALP